MRAAKYVGAWLICALALALVGCANTLDAAQQTRGALSRALDESTQAWVTYNRAKEIQIAQDALTREAARSALTAYRQGEQAKVIKAINGCWAALFGLDRAIALYSAGTKGGLQAALGVAYGSLSDIAQTLTALGIPIPKVN